jgi:hypothetical protein
MNLELAILHTLTASPRAISAKVIRGFSASFTGRSHTLADIERTLRRLEEKGDVAGTDTRERDENERPIFLYKETPDGRLRVL